MCPGIREAVCQTQDWNSGGTGGDKMVCTFAEEEIMMIKLINDEGHRDNINNEADDNDSLLSAFISL